MVRGADGTGDRADGAAALRAQAQEQGGEVFELHHRYRDGEDDVQDQMSVAVCP